MGRATSATDAGPTSNTAARTGAQLAKANGRDGDTGQAPTAEARTKRASAVFSSTANGLVRGTPVCASRVASNAGGGCATSRPTRGARLRSRRTRRCRASSSGRALGGTALQAGEQQGLRIKTGLGTEKEASTTVDEDPKLLKRHTGRR